MIPKDAGGCFLLYVMTATMTAAHFCETGKISLIGVFYAVAAFHLGHSYSCEYLSTGGGK